MTDERETRRKTLEEARNAVYAASRLYPQPAEDYSENPHLFCYQNDCPAAVLCKKLAAMDAEDARRAKRNDRNQNP